jgi:hypothetical protein
LLSPAATGEAPDTINVKRLAMLKLSANLKWLFTEVPLLDRFAKRGPGSRA